MYANLQFFCEYFRVVSWDIEEFRGLGKRQGNLIEYLDSIEDENVREKVENLLEKPDKNELSRIICRGVAMRISDDLDISPHTVRVVLSRLRRDAPPHSSKRTAE